MRVVVVEDQALLREALVAALAAHRITVVGEAHDQESALAVVRATTPDVVMLDVRMPPGFADEGIRAAEAIRSSCPGVGLLVLSTYGELDYAERLLNLDGTARSVGYLLKDRVGEVAGLVEAMQRIAAGEVVLDSSIIDRLMRRRQGKDPLGRLTPQEWRILSLVAEGRSNQGIAQLLGLSTSTVEKQLSGVMDKLALPAATDQERPGVNLRVLAALTFLRQNGQLTQRPHPGRNVIRTDREER